MAGYFAFDNFNYPNGTKLGAETPAWVVVADWWIDSNNGRAMVTTVGGRDTVTQIRWHTSASTANYTVAAKAIYDVMPTGGGYFGITARTYNRYWHYILRYNASLTRWETGRAKQDQPGTISALATYADATFGPGDTREIALTVTGTNPTLAIAWIDGQIVMTDSRAPFDHRHTDNTPPGIAIDTNAEPGKRGIMFDNFRAWEGPNPDRLIVPGVF